jgi:chaperonin cofactor prefoldin
MVELVEKQQERITELEGRQDTYEAAIEALQKRDREMQKQIRDLEGQNRWLVRENTVLRQSLHEHGIDVPEFRAQE